ncbi:hypothetical protein PENTCL1PPCAC_28184, partial [Pristionchus entomophagus]
SRKKSIVKEPKIVGLRITRALSIAYTIQLILLSIALLSMHLCCSSGLCTIVQFTTIPYLISAAFIFFFFIAETCRNRSLLLVVFASQIAVFGFSVGCVIFMMNDDPKKIALKISVCIILFLIYLVIPLIAFLTNRSAHFFRITSNVDCFVRESIKIQESVRGSEVLELSPTDLHRSYSFTAEAEQETLDLPAPVSRFHSISLDSYHDCKEP